MKIIAVLIGYIMQGVCLLIPILLIGLRMLLMGIVALIRMFSGSNNVVENCGLVGREVGEHVGGEVGESIGNFFGPTWGSAGNVAGGAAGAFAGEKLGKYVGENYG